MVETFKGRALIPGKLKRRIIMIDGTVTVH